MSDAEQIRLAHAGDREARTLLGTRLLPIIQRSVARRLYPLAKACKRDPLLDRDDFVHGVWIRLFEQDWRVLRGYDPERGALESYVATVADRYVLDAFRTKSRDPYANLPMTDDQLELRRGLDTRLEPQAAARDELGRLYTYLQSRLDARGLLLFQMLEVERLPVPEVCERAEMSRDALYQWRARLRRIVKQWRTSQAPQSPKEQRA